MVKDTVGDRMVFTSEPVFILAGSPLLVSMSLHRKSFFAMSKQPSVLEPPTPNTPPDTRPTLPSESKESAKSGPAEKWEKR